MKKICVFFVGAMCMVQNVAMGAVAIKKAAPVATQKQSAADATGSLVPTVINLISNVKSLNQKQKALTADCLPTTAEINFVNDTMKEFAKTGAMTADEIYSSLHVQKCEDASGMYAQRVQLAAADDEDRLLCYDWFSDENTIWYGYPKAVKAYYCTDGSISRCGEKDRQDVSNIYELFNVIDFSTDDYTPQEAKMAGQLMDKIEKCSYAKLSAKKRALWGEFLTTTVGSMGQKTNTGAIMQAVTNMSNNSGNGTMGVLQSLGGIATQFMAQ